METGLTKKLTKKKKEQAANTKDPNSGQKKTQPNDGPKQLDEERADAPATNLEE